jgi:Tol biopolymer transport system component
MRSTQWTHVAFALLGLAACRGDDGDAPVDARRIDAAGIDAAIDGADIDAAGIDAATDAAIDGSMPGTTTVWVYGDIVTNNLAQLGKFAHPATGVATPTFVPAAGDLPSTNFPVPFSIAADNSRVVYVARAVAADPWKLSYAAADGSGTVDVFTAPAGRAITDVALSPDKTKIAIRADLEGTAGMFDVYVVAAAANSTPVRVSPDRAAPAAALSAQAFLSWSADSRYLAFGGDFVTDNLNELRIRDTMANTTATPLATAAILSTTGTRGLALAPVWGNGNKLFVTANLTAANERRIYTANADGTGFAVLGNTLLTRGDATMSQANNFALSPDGNTIVFASDGVVATAFELYSMPSTGAAAPTRLTAGTVAAARGVDIFRPMRFNPAGTAVAFGADYGATDDKFQPYVVTVAGGALRRLAVIGLDTDNTRDVQNIAWTPDGAFLYAIADAGAADNDFGVYALDATMTDQATTAVIVPPMSGDAFEVAVRRAP